MTTSCENIWWGMWINRWDIQSINMSSIWPGDYLAIPPLYCTVYPKKYAHGFCFAVLCSGYTLTDFPISISNDCPSASKATLMNMDKYFMWIHYEWLHNHNKAKHNKTVCIFLGIYCKPGLLLLTILGLGNHLFSLPPIMYQTTIEDCHSAMNDWGIL